MNKIIREKNIEIFGLLESKLKIEGIELLENDMSVDWMIFSNIDRSLDGDRASILLGF